MVAPAGVVSWRWRGPNYSKPLPPVTRHRQASQIPARAPRAMHVRTQPLAGNRRVTPLLRDSCVGARVLVGKEKLLIGVFVVAADDEV